MGVLVAVAVAVEVAVCVAVAFAVPAGAAPTITRLFPYIEFLFPCKVSSDPAANAFRSTAYELDMRSCADGKKKVLLPVSRITSLFRLALRSAACCWRCR